MKTRTALVLLALWVAAHGVAIVTWLQEDRSQPAGETALYLLQARRVAGALANPAPGMTEAVLSALPEPFPPLFAAVASPFVLAAPDNPDAAALAQIVFVAIAAAGAFALGRALRGNGTGLVCAILLTSTTFAAIYEHRPQAEMPLLACAMVATAAFVFSDFYKHRGPSIAFGIAAGCGMLAHWNFAFLLPGPGLAVAGALVYYILRKTSGVPGSEPPGVRAGNALLALGTAAAVAAPWILVRGKDAIGHAGTARPVVSLDGFLYYFFALEAQTSLSFAAAVLTGAGLVALSWVARGGNAAPVVLPDHQRIRALFFVWIPAWIALSLAPTKDARFVSILLAPLAGFVAYVFCGLRFSIVRAPAVALLCGLQVLGFLAVSFGWLADDDLRVRPQQTLKLGSFDLRVYQPHPAPGPLQPEPGRRVLALVNVKNPPDTRDPDPRRALDAIARDLGDRRATICAITAQDILHSAALRNLVEAHYPKWKFFDVREYYVGDPKEREFAAFSPYELLSSNYWIIARRRGGALDFERNIHAFNARFIEYLQTRPPIFEKKFSRIFVYEPIKDPFSRANDFIVEVYRRNSPVDAEEVQQWINGIARFDRLKPGTWVDVAFYWYHAGRRADALKILDVNVKDPGVLAPVHRDRLAQIRSVGN